MSLLKPREDRQTVRLPVRLRTDEGWSDAVIRNVSRRGMRLDCLSPPGPSDFIEIARGRVSHVGRVVWKNATSCGVIIRENVDLDMLRNQKPAASRSDVPERRQRFRAPPQDYRQKAEEARALGQAFERCAMIAALVAACFFAASLVYQALSTPVAAVSKALAASQAEEEPPTRS